MEMMMPNIKVGRKELWMENKNDIVDR